MKLILIFTLTVCFFSTVLGNEKNADFDLNKLSTVGQNAYNILLKAQRFEEGLIGYAAQLSKNVISLNDLAKEKEADAAFKSLLKNAELAGQLYALCGLYYTDYDFFKKEIQNYKEKEDSLETMSGCLVFSKKVLEIVNKNAKNVAIISPQETMEDWWKKNKGSYELDILHGGFPATFRHYKNRKQ